MTETYIKIANIGEKKCKQNVNQRNTCVQCAAEHDSIVSAIAAAATTLCLRSHAQKFLAQINGMLQSCLGGLTSKPVDPRWRIRWANNKTKRPKTETSWVQRRQTVVQQIV